MTGSSVDDKRADERRIKELREFQRANPANKRCFDCNEMMPQYICVDFNTFVCTSCSGIHREFGHRVKSISMSKFTDTEVKNMLKFGGNETAQKIWRAKHDASFRPSGGTDGERTRNFMRLTYIDKKWQYESPRPSARDEQPQKASGANKSGGFDGGDDFFGGSSSTKSAPSPSFDTFSQPSPQNNSGGFANFGDFGGFDQPKKQQNDFDDFGGFSSSTSSSKPSATFGDFGGFTAKPAAAPPLRDEFKTGSFTLAPPPGADFGGFGAATPAPVSVPSAPAKAANDFLAFSPPSNPPRPSDPFGFADSPVAAKKTNSQTGATPFDAFGSPTTAATPNRSSFDAFGDASAKTGSRSSFDAFGDASAAKTGSRSSFDAFGSAAVSSPSANFGAFGSAAPLQPVAPSSPGFGSFNSAPAPASAFDAFGAASTPAPSAFDAFGSPAASGSRSSSATTQAPSAFGAATASSRTNSGAFGSPMATAASPDPFVGFGARTNNATKLPEQKKDESADPFAAFESLTLDSPAPAPAPATPSPSPYDAFGAATSTPASQPFGVPQASQAQAFGQAQQPHTSPAPNADPFAFAASGTSSKTNSFSSNGPGAPTKTSSFTNGPQQTPGGFGAYGAPQQQMQGAFGQPQQHVQGAFGQPQQQMQGAFGQPQQQQSGMYPPSQQAPSHFQQQQQQQQMYHQQSMNGQYPQQPQMGQFPQQGFGMQGQQHPQQQQQQWMQQNNGGFGVPSQQSQSAPTPPPAAPKAEPPAAKDPFASLGLGNLGMAKNTNSNPGSRVNSASKPAISPATSATSSFSNNSAASPFGASVSVGFGMSGPPSTGGSRGNSFNAPKMGGSSSSAPSPMGSFSMQPTSHFAPAAPSPTFPATSPLPMGSFGFPAQNTPQKQSSFSDPNAFDAFGTPSKTDSQHAASSNPFDMF